MLTLLTQLPWHLIDCEQLVQLDQRGQRVEGLTTPYCQAVRLRTKHHVAGANGVPAQVFEEPVARRSVVYYALSAIGLEGMRKGIPPSGEELVADLQQVPQLLAVRCGDTHEHAPLPQNKKYRCASARVGAGSQVNTCPSALTT